MGEGYADRPGWREHDAGWVGVAASSTVIISVPGMAALTVAMIYRRPIILAVTAQPEQVANAERAAVLGLEHKVVQWDGRVDEFANVVKQACRELLDGALRPLAVNEGIGLARQRIDAWSEALRTLAETPEANR